MSFQPQESDFGKSLWYNRLKISAIKLKNIADFSKNIGVIFENNADIF